MALRKSTKYIVLHCAATRAVQDIGAKEIEKWHRERGWSGIGYHFVIRRDGKIEKGRSLSHIGAHVANHNSNTLGICLVGGLANEAPYRPENNFTPAQWKSLEGLVRDMLKIYPEATILGHRDFPKVAKACPCFDARAWAKREGFPAAPSLRGSAGKATAVTVASLTSSEGASTAANTVETHIEQLQAIASNETLTTLSTTIKWVGYGLAAIAAISAAYALYRAARVGWRMWKGEGDYGSEETESA